MKNPIWDNSYNLPILRPAITITIKKNWLVDYGSYIYCLPLITFLEEHGRDLDVLHIVDAPKVIEESRDVQLVQDGSGALARGIVVVSVNAEHGHGDVQIPAHVIDFLPAAVGEIHVGPRQNRDLDLSIAERVLPQEIHAFDDTVPGGFVLVEEIPAEQDEIHLLRMRQL